MSKALPFAQVKLGSPQDLVCALALRDVLGCTEHFVGPAGRVVLQISQAMYKTDFSVGKKQAMFTIDVHPGPNSLVCYPKHSLAILGVDSLGHRREFNRAFPWRQSMNSVIFVRTD